MRTDYQPSRNIDLPRLIITVIVVACLATLVMLLIMWVNP